jgi:ABC-type Na+ efflux pump permease subunit
VLALWLLAWAVWKAQWPSPANLYATAFLLVMLVDMFQLQSPARDIASHRRDGMFELLLTAPLEPREIVDGEIRGLAKQFGPLRKALCALFVVMMLGGLATRPWTWRALVTYFLIWGLLIMFAGTNRRRSLPTIMWIALNSGRGAWAVMRSQGRAWPWLFNMYNFRNAFAAFGSGALKFPSGSETEFWVVAAGAAFAVVIMVVAIFEKNPLHRRLVDEMRAIVQEPVPSPKDPRFRRWNVKERFPSERKVI